MKRYLGVCLLVSVLAACTKVRDLDLPDSSTLGSPRGYRMVRVITHDHSPYSYDACDSAGLVHDVPRADCLHDLKDALCHNRIDVLFLSDHPDKMQNFEMKDLLLIEEGDHPLTGADGTPYVNQIKSCKSDFVPSLMVGFEGRVLSLGMMRHAAATVSERTALYEEETPELRATLADVSEAVVMIPHTESRSLDLIRSLEPDGIEIYNVHANLDPKIRKSDLGIKPFDHLPRILTYLLDPYKSLNADYMFMQFVFVHPDYFTKWDILISEGRKIAGFGGSDSHENIFPQTASDGERLDSHRRLTRFMSNHLLVNSTDPLSVRTALKNGRGWLVFEGLGSPVGMDLSASVDGTVIGVGESVSLKSATATISVKVPSLHPKSYHGDESPEIRAVLLQVISGGHEKVVASSSGGEISYRTTTAGAYRAEIWMRPRQLREELGDFSALADGEYRWIITNHVYIEP